MVGQNTWSKYKKSVNINKISNKKVQHFTFKKYQKWFAYIIKNIKDYAINSNLTIIGITILWDWFVGNFRW